MIKKQAIVVKIIIDIWTFEFVYLSIIENEKVMSSGWILTMNVGVVLEKCLLYFCFLPFIAKFVTWILKIFFTMKLSLYSNFFSQVIIKWVSVKSEIFHEFLIICANILLPFDETEHRKAFIFLTIVEYRVLYFPIFD